MWAPKSCPTGAAVDIMWNTSQLGDADALVTLEATCKRCTGSAPRLVCAYIYAKPLYYFVFIVFSTNDTPCDASVFIITQTEIYAHAHPPTHT